MVLAWLLVVLAGVVVLVSVGLLIALLAGAVAGVRRMRADEDMPEVTIRKDASAAPSRPGRSTDEPV